jgi:hypothetical protein
MLLAYVTCLCLPMFECLKEEQHVIVSAQLHKYPLDDHGYLDVHMNMHVG